MMTAPQTLLMTFSTFSLNLLPSRDTSVDTSVGATRADDVHRMALQCAQHGLQLPLDGVLVRLALPAEEAGAVVGDGEPVVLFHKKITPFLPYCNRKDVICEVFYSQPIIWTKLYSSFRP